MNLEQAKLLRKQLLPLEGMIASKTREYIWKVVIGPEDARQFESFCSMIDPGRPLDQRTIMKPFLTGELSLYFLCKIDGRLLCRGYMEFLRANDTEMQELQNKMPAPGFYREEQAKNNFTNQSAINRE